MLDITYLAMTMPRLVKLHRLKFLFNSCLCPKAASSRTSSISPFVFSGVTPSWDAFRPETVMVSVQVGQYSRKESHKGVCKRNVGLKRVTSKKETPSQAVQEKGEPANDPSERQIRPATPGMPQARVNTHMASTCMRRFGTIHREGKMTPPGSFPIKATVLWLYSQLLVVDDVGRQSWFS